MKKWIENITRRPLWVNMLAAVAAVFLFLLIFFGSLSLLTGHGKIQRVPSITGQTILSATKTLEAAGKLEEALDNAQQCLNHRLEYEGPDSFYTNHNRFDVARVFHKLERDQEALDMLNQLDSSLNSDSELSDDVRQLMADASGLRSTIEGYQ
jgi:hypothetical protein